MDASGRSKQSCIPCTIDDMIHSHDVQLQSLKIRIGRSIVSMESFRFLIDSREGNLPLWQDAMPNFTYMSPRKKRVVGRLSLDKGQGVL
jgi:hypothetical protein